MPLSPIDINTLSFAEEIKADVSDRVPFRLKHSEIRIGMGDVASGVPVLGVNLTGLTPAGFTVGLPGAIGMNDIVRAGADVLATDGSIQARLIDVVADQVFGEARMELAFDTKPDAVVALPFRSWGMTLLRQPYMQGGPDPFIDFEGNYRAPDVCGSWAIYDPLKNRKLMHLRRPRIFDGLGNEGLIPHPDFPGVPIPAVDLNITPTAFVFSIDPAWLASAPLPITIDPNLGYDTIGSTNGVDTQRICYKTATEGGSGDSYDTIYIYNGADTTPTYMGTAVYDDSAGQPNNLVQGGPEPAGATGWISASITTVNTSASTTYYIAFQGYDGSIADQIDPRFDTGTTGDGCQAWNGTTYYLGPTAADPAQLTNYTNQDRLYSAYLQPAAGGGGLSIPVAMNHYRRARAA